MKWIRTTFTAFTAASIATVVGACSGGGVLEKPTRSTSSAPSTTSSAPSVSTPTIASPSTAYDPNSPQERAKETVRAYFEVSGTCLQDPPKAKATCFDAVAISTALNDLRSSLSSAQAAQTKQIGLVEVVSTKILKTDLTNKPKETPPTIPIVTVAVCYDVRKVNVVDYSGKSIVPPDRKPRAFVNMAVVNYKYPDPTQWRVEYLVPTGKSC